MKTRIYEVLKGNSTTARYLAMKLLLKVEFSMNVGKMIRLLKK